MQRFCNSNMTVLHPGQRRCSKCANGPVSFVLVTHPIVRELNWGYCHRIFTLWGCKVLGTAYFAERDENNEVCALWVRPSDRKSARVFDPATEVFNRANRVSISGATEAEIEQWLAVQRAISAR